jgi:hypothetical protein
MTIEAAREKLHEIIDHASEQEIMTLLSLAEGIEDVNYKYDDATLSMLKERSEAYLSGKAQTFSIEESLERIKVHRKKNGL